MSHRLPFTIALTPLDRVALAGASARIQQAQRERLLILTAMLNHTPDLPPDIGTAYDVGYAEGGDSIVCTPKSPMSRDA